MKMAMKANMGMKRKMAIKKSVIGKRRSVWSGAKHHTGSGLTKADLKKNKAGKIVSRKASARSAKSKGAKVISAWGKAPKQARKQLGIKGFCPVGGKSARGQKLLKAVRSIVKK